ncbi:MAG TPA: LUD domain-containing protein [Bacteroidia bacterium]|nr:LUD domain-containing protein [Bacteroidia bacterium]HRS59305.1 LUD domain-containing protein [Bacteroidia bacterium]HRU68245.1 LUD domain-containing protein [Bacteroidia bacterium]
MREKVLKKIRNSAVKGMLKTDTIDNENKHQLYEIPDENLVQVFAREFSKINGKFIYCFNNHDMVTQLRQLIQGNKWKNVYCTEESIRYILNDTSLKYKYDINNYQDADVSITSCEALVARTGSILVSTSHDKTRKLTVFPPVHIVLAYFDQIYFDFENALKTFKDRYHNRYPSMLSIISGPSRTADIEKTLVLGAHGPKELYCFYINER